MTQQEFQNLTGMTVTAEQFESINAAYMACGDRFDKEAFCKDYKKHGESTIIEELVGEVKALRILANRRKNDVDYALELLIEGSSSGCVEEDIAAQTAIDILGMREYLRRKAAKKVEFTEKDLEMLADLLKA